MRYLVRLKPMDSFFFSGRETFRFSKGEKSKDTNHFVMSEKYPQQTTILGMIKRELLIMKGYYRENRMDYAKDIGKSLNSEELYKLVGRGSFNPNTTNNFGIIEEISPLFLWKEKEFYINAPLDNGYDYEEQKGSVYLGGTTEDVKGKIGVLKGYKDKDGLKRKIIAVNPYNPINEYKESDIFKEDIRIGIGVKDEEAFYKQQFYRLENDFEFAFFLELSEDLFGKEYTSTVYIGGESKPFKLTIEKSDKQIFEKYEMQGNRIVCVSDVILEESNFEKIKKDSSLIVGETKYFKNFRVVEGKKEDSNAMLILKRGTVIFTEKDKVEEIKKIIEKEENQKIGYNHILGGKE